MFVHSFNPILFDFGIIAIRWYSLAYIFGIILGLSYGKYLIRKFYFHENVKPHHLDDFLIWIVLGIILGGRLGYVIFYNLQFYLQNPLDIFKIWSGGMSFHGGMIGLIIATAFFVKKNNISFWLLTDVLACVAPIGLFFGRIANFINGELVGKPTDIAWSVIFPMYDNVARHPSQLYEALLEGLVLFIVVNQIFKKNTTRIGYPSFLFLFLYSFFRICAEFFREPDQHIGYVFPNISLGIILSFITIVLSFVILIKINKNDFKKNNKKKKIIFRSIYKLLFIQI